MKKIKPLLFLFLILSSFNKTNDRIRLIFEAEKTSRSSFCMYSDGMFYETRASGCVGQIFSSGNWTISKDTITLTYQTNNVFEYEVLKSADTAGTYQIVRIVDCYDQPVRFQYVYFDTTCQNLYNPGIYRVEKGKSISYVAPVFERKSEWLDLPNCNADTITYKWHSNRESIESIDGGDLYVNKGATIRKVLLRNNRIVSLPE